MRVFHIARRSFALDSSNRNENVFSSTESLSVSEMSESCIARISSACRLLIVQTRENGVAAIFITPLQMYLQQPCAQSQEQLAEQ
jgi:hypothetical protein